jgi:hypothetical protein
MKNLEQALATVRAAGYRVSKPKPRKTKSRVGPTFVATFADGQVTRMSTFTSLENLDIDRGLSAKEKELADSARLLRAWKHFHREQLEQALAGVHGAVLARLMEQLKALRSARELVDFIAAQDWEKVDAETQLIALHEINTAICRLRERAGQEPIDDGVPGEHDNAFRLIKAILSFPPHSGEARRG